MDAQGAIGAERGPELFSGEALVVDAVARLVQDAEEGLIEPARIVARRDAAVAGAVAATEWVGGDVEPAGTEVETNRRSRRLAENLLPFDRVVALQEVSLRRPAGRG